ncbi:MAG: hypothetical protein GX442_23530, partial [Candidatus Riflebacteria bacterium]|nr:hypothetical protein [Candidatus Riflebacteria bacterium]
MPHEPIPPQVKDETYRQQTECPSCGRFIGIFERCPYCQALTPKRLSIRAFKVISVLTSTVGLLLLLFYAQTIKTPEVKIADLGPLSNFAHVRVVGEVERSYGIHKQWQSLAFTITQPGPATEPVTIRISAYSKVAKEIAERDLVPADGDLVSVEGTVRFQRETPSLLINAPEHLQILKRAPAAVVAEVLEPAKVTRDHIGKTITVRGTLARALNFPRGTILGVEGLDKGFCYWLPAEVRDGLKVTLRQGDLIEASGKVKTFKDSLEVEIGEAANLKVVTPGPGEPLSLAPREQGNEEASQEGAAPAAPPTPTPSP